MNGMTIANAVKDWMDRKNIAYSCVRDERFSCILDGTGSRVGFFLAKFEVSGDMLRLHFTFPVSAHEDEMLDTKFALSRINGALKTGCVHRDAMTSSLIWSAGARMDEESDAAEIIGWLVCCGQSVLEGYTDYISHLLMNGWEAEEELPELDLQLPEDIRLLTGEQATALWEDDDEDDDEEEYAEQLTLAVSRLEESDEAEDPFCGRFRKYLNVFKTIMTGNGRNRLCWHRWLYERMDTARIELHALPGAFSLLVRLPVFIDERHEERMQELLDGINRKLRYGVMRISGRNGSVCYSLRIRQDDRYFNGFVRLYQEAYRMVGGCSDAILRAAFDRNAPVSLLIGLCGEAVSELNKFCKEENVKEYHL